MRILHLAAVAALFSAAVAHADTLKTFTFENTTFADGATGSGTVVIDKTNGTFQNVDFTVTDGATQYIFDGAAEQTASMDGDQVFTNYVDQDGDILVLDVHGSTLTGYNGSRLCSMDHQCDGMIGDIHFADGVYDGIESGSLAPTPEPSSILLLGSGLVGAAAMVRRRVAA